MGIRVLYSFPHKLGAARICNTAWQQVHGVAAAGVEVVACPGVLQRALPVPNVTVHPTLAACGLRLPYRLIGRMQACRLHDQIVARRLEKLASCIDIVHAWPLGSLRTLSTAKKLGIPAVLERPNAHTRFAYEVVHKECERLDVALPPKHEHAFQHDVLAREEMEYSLADRLLCPSEFTARTFLDYGFPPEKLVRHQYGYDPSHYFPAPNTSKERPFTALFVGVCAVRKGLHFALESWLKSPACLDGVFLIAGAFLPAYASRLEEMLSHPSVRVLGHRNDIPDLMRNSDILLLPSIEEGSPLACAEAIGSGCVPVASDACNGSCTHMKNSLIHPVGDVAMLTEHISLLHRDRELLDELQSNGLNDASELTWAAAGVKLRDIYTNVISDYKREGATR